ncbi:Hypothetical_protein [Hexamita inflata]|uniref:Hypothetical_protein n=1 Tax=Hexamita inflata TaxID=28002 RepID=A0AA86Q7H0_9EUKA|nr:Hypothetical protein HINF_LOCUS39761 [Hexamita inflata]CAI9952119.1 Hypothetical protein HINF_LOCUS39764 [Hexamita inflata]
MSPRFTNSIYRNWFSLCREFPSKLIAQNHYCIIHNYQIFNRCFWALFSFKQLQSGRVFPSSYQKALKQEHEYIILSIKMPENQISRHVYSLRFAWEVDSLYLQCLVTYYFLLSFFLRREGFKVFSGSSDFQTDYYLIQLIDYQQRRARNIFQKRFQQ